MTLASRSAQPMTRADLDAVPDDGYRHELIDGLLVVSPSPRHRRVLAAPYRVLFAALPDGLEVLFAPFDVALPDDTDLVPDLLVAPVGDVTDRDLPVAPLPAAGPSTRTSRG